jgi:F-type H+-transporting ATPase subunit b
MNVPLNIDWQQILLHLLNFSVLTFGLYLLLYKPVKTFMDERAKHYETLDTQAKEKLEQAEKLEASYNKRLKDIEAEIENKKAGAAVEAKKAADLILRNARQQAEGLLSDAREAAQAERAKILDDSRQEIAYMAMTAAEKLLEQSASGALDQFLTAVKKE